MIALALALGAALAFGVSDFTAGLASRRTHYLWVTLGSVAIALALVTASLPWTGRFPPAVGPTAWGAVSGLGTAVGSLALYRGFGRGEMSVVAPLSAVGAAVLPALLGVVLGDRLPPLAILGVVVALPAIWLVSKATSESGSAVRGGAVDGAIAGVGFGLLFVGLNRAGPRDGLWPVAAGEAVALVVIGLAVLLTRPARPTPGSKVGGLVVVTGALGVLGTISYFFATQWGMLTIAAVVTSLYPAFTVLLAFLVLHERPNRPQLIGLTLCAVAIVSIVAA